MIRGVLTYIRALPNMEDYDRICTDLFGSPKDPRGMKLRDAVRYFQVDLVGTPFYESTFFLKAFDPVVRVEPMRVF